MRRPVFLWCRGARPDRGIGYELFHHDLAVEIGVPNHENAAHAAPGILTYKRVAAGHFPHQIVVVLTGVFQGRRRQRSGHRERPAKRGQPPGATGRQRPRHIVPFSTQDVLEKTFCPLHHVGPEDPRGEHLGAQLFGGVGEVGREPGLRVFFREPAHMLHAGNEQARFV